MRQPWMRKVTDTKLSWEAFRVYRDMGTHRSLAKLGERFGKSTGQMARWSIRHRWTERVRAFDLDRCSGNHL